MDYLAIQEDALIEVSRMQREAGVPIVAYEEDLVDELDTED